MSLYRNLDPPALDAAYNNGEAVGAARRATYVADWQARSAALLRTAEARLDLRYGDGPRQTIDFFPAPKRGAPTLLFIHGGYWQGGDKENFRFVAAGPLAHGLNVALIEYNLAPAVRMDAIVAEIGRGGDWLVAHLAEFGAADGIHLAGHSAGGHLAAMTMNWPGVKSAMPISGVFDLEPIRLNYLNDKLGLDEAEAARNSPLLHLPKRTPPLLIAVGGAELPELRRQSTAYHAALTDQGVAARFAELAGHDHFSIIEELARPEGRLTAALVEFASRT